MKPFSRKIITNQVIPLGLTGVIFAGLVGILYLEILTLNHFTASDIIPHLRLSDILVGATIYLKTSVDFAIFIGNLMANYPGWKNRVAIEIGTAGGNALGTFIILFLWNVFRNIEWLLAIMVFFAALVLLQLAQDGVKHTQDAATQLPKKLNKIINVLDVILTKVNSIFAPLLKRLIPHASMRTSGKKTFKGLFLFSFTIPFILGLDDFAGYVPVFNLVNVFGFATGVLLGHMVLNIFLFVSPNKTIKLVKNPIISLLGSITFIGLALWGFYEVIRIIF